MWLIATDVTHSVVRVSVCLCVTRMHCTKTAKPIEMPFGGGAADSYGSKEPLDGVKIFRGHDSMTLCEVL